MTCIVNPNQYPTKKALREHITAGKPVTIDDPSIFNPRLFYASDLTRREALWSEYFKAAITGLLASEAGGSYFASTAVMLTRAEQVADQALSTHTKWWPR